MQTNAPHLPEEVTTQKTHNHFFVLVFFVISLFAGMGGGLLVVYVALPALIPQQTILNNPIISNKIKTGDSPVFGIMGALTHSAHLLTGSKDQIGYAVQLSSDGWLLTHKSVALQKKIAIEVHNERVAVDRIVFDQAQDIAFIHVPITFFSIPDIEEKSKIFIGQEVYVPTPTKGVQILHYSALFSVPKSSGQFFSSDAYFRLHVLDKPLDASYAGAPVFNAKGSLVGVVRGGAPGENAMVAPLFDISAVFKQAAKDSRIVRPYLGVHYVVASGARLDVDAEPLGVTLVSGAKYGVRAVEKNAPAFVAGLREKDVIVAVEGEDVGRVRSLPDLILAYRPGQEIMLTVLRNGERTKIPVILGVKK